MNSGHSDTELMVQRLGPQRPTDPPLLRRVRAHQSWYRSEVLGLSGWGEVPTPRATQLGSILSLKDASEGYNFVSPQARQAYNDRRLTGWGVDPVRCERYMTSSQALTLNILGPLLASPEWTARTLGLCLEVQIGEVSRSFIEFAPRERLKTIGDRTIADAYVEMNVVGRKLGIVVETKYADGFGARNLDVAHNPKYLALNERFSIWDEVSMEFGAGKFDQLARIHALGSVTVGAAATLLILHHPLDTKTPEIAERYRASLIDPSLLFIEELGAFFAAMREGAREPGQRKLVDELKLRYLEHDRSEAAWRAMSSR
jgi:hypothetical protein